MDMPNVQTSEESSSERISVLESLQKQSLQTADRFDASITKLQISLDKMFDKLSDVGKPQWNTMAAWAGVIIIFIGMVGGSVIGNVISNQTRMENISVKQMERYNDYVYRTAEKDGSQTEKIAALERSLLLLTDIHKQDMNIYRTAHAELKKESKEDVASASALLDQRLQRELNDRVSPVEKKLDILEQRVYDLVNKR